MRVHTPVPLGVMGVAEAVPLEVGVAEAVPYLQLTFLVILVDQDTFKANKEYIENQLSKFRP